LDPKKFAVDNDEKLVLDFLQQEKILLVQGTAFNWPQPDHLRVVFLPRADDLQHALERFAVFLGRM
jgi:alanine-synthesizing transaminase